jgi:hypothetical protein
MYRTGALLARALARAPRMLALVVTLTLAGGLAVLPSAPDALRLSPSPSAGVGHVTAITGPARRFAADSRAMAVAESIARAYWGRDACGGHVTLEWMNLGRTTNARSLWRNAVDSYADPDRNTDCRIEFNERAEFDWPKFCTVVVHEYGHLTGHPHVPDPGDVMAAVYSTPLIECARTADPSRHPRSTNVRGA